MNTLLILLFVVLGIGVLILLFGVQIFNRLVTLRNRVDNAFSQIEVQLKRRHDLIPNLVENGQGVHGPRKGDARSRHQRQESGGRRLATGVGGPR